MWIINCGAGVTREVDETKFNDEVKEYLMRLGISNALHDCHAGRKAKAAELVDKKLTALYAGEIRSPVGRQVNNTAKRELALMLARVWAEDEGLSSKAATELAKQRVAEKWQEPPKVTQERPRKRAA